MMPGERPIALEITALLRRGLVEGYVLVVTDRRIAGFKSLKAGVVGTGSTVRPFLGGSVGGVLQQRAEREMAQRPEEKMREHAGELLSRDKKDFEFFKDQVARIEFGPASLLRGAELRVVPRSGEPVKLQIRVPKSTHPFYQHLVTVAQRFLPESVVLPPSA